MCFSTWAVIFTFFRGFCCNNKCNKSACRLLRSSSAGSCVSCCLQFTRESAVPVVDPIGVTVTQHSAGRSLTGTHKPIQVPSSFVSEKPEDATTTTTTTRTKKEPPKWFSVVAFPLCKSASHLATNTRLLKKNSLNSRATGGCFGSERF